MRRRRPEFICSSAKMARADSLDSGARLTNTSALMSAHDAEGTNQLDAAPRSVHEEQKERRRYEPPRLEQRGRVERTTLFSGGGQITP